MNIYLLNLYQKSWIRFFRIKARLLNKTIVHFFHIGKTGGSVLKLALKDKNNTYQNKAFIVLFHGHSMSLKGSFKGEKFFFFVRDPASRFVSGFYSRKRKGAPKFHYEWSENEKIAFNRFNTPDELARAMSSDDEKRRMDAQHAMQNISHVNSSYWDWFEDEDSFLFRIDDLLFIGSQSSFEKDFERLKTVLSIPNRIKLPQSNKETHKTPGHFDTNLSEISRHNLHKYYHREYEFLEFLRKNELI